ncbi:hypothetical protein GGR65_000156 [Xanthomonas sp. 3376]|nr:hypothetical protein [Xanthomonas arboricola]
MGIGRAGNDRKDIGGWRTFSHLHDCCRHAFGRASKQNATAKQRDRYAAALICRP